VQKQLSGKATNQELTLLIGIVLTVSNIFTHCRVFFHDIFCSRDK